MMHATHPLATGLTDELEQQLARHFAQHTLTLEHGAQAVRMVEATAYVPEARHRLYTEQRAIQRPQLPADVSGAVVFALSDLARFITGQTLPVNGGFVMP